MKRAKRKRAGITGPQRSSRNPLHSMVRAVLAVRLLNRVFALAREFSESALRIFLLLGLNLAILLEARFLNFFTWLGWCSRFGTVARRDRTTMMFLAHDL